MFAADHGSRVRRLYKLIFRVHRALPPELRIMGDNYARDEFKRHKKCNPPEAKIFLTEWTVSMKHIYERYMPIFCRCNYFLTLKYTHNIMKVVITVSYK